MIEPPISPNEITEIGRMNNTNNLIFCELLNKVLKFVKGYGKIEILFRSFNVMLIINIYGIP